MKTIEIDGKEYEVADEVAEYILWIKTRLKTKASVGKKYEGDINEDVDKTIELLNNVRDKVIRFNEDI